MQLKIKFGRTFIANRILTRGNVFPSSISVRKNLPPQSFPPIKGFGYNSKFASSKIIGLLTIEICKFILVLMLFSKHYFVAMTFQHFSLSSVHLSVFKSCGLFHLTCQWGSREFNEK